jgi:hypothetical protein
MRVLCNTIADISTMKGWLLILEEGGGKRF